MTCCAPGFSAFNPSAFNAAFPSAWWRNDYIMPISTNQIGGFNQPKSFATTPLPDLYLASDLNQNQETTEGRCFVFGMPFNWKPASGLKCWLHWFVTAEGSHGNPVKWQWFVRGISDGETMSFNQTYTNNDDTESANDLVYITPTLNLTPGTASSLKPKDLLYFTIRRQNDTSTVHARLLGMHLSYEIDATVAVP